MSLREKLVRLQTYGFQEKRNHGEHVYEASARVKRKKNRASLTRRESV
jgi:hypothetical protein